MFKNISIAEVRKEGAKVRRVNNIVIQKFFIHLSIFLILVVSTSFSNEYVVRPIDEHINEASLIIKGKLIKKHAKQESLDGVKYKVYTTYVFLIEDILKGKYSENTIDVKMLGGCDKKLGICESNPFSYNFNIDDTAVLFLDYYKNSTYFKVTQASNTVFLLDEKNNLFRFFDDAAKSSDYETMDKENKLVHKKHLNLKILKSIIKRLK